MFCLASNSVWWVVPLAPLELGQCCVRFALLLLECTSVARGHLIEAGDGIFHATISNENRKSLHESIHEAATYV